MYVTATEAKNRFGYVCAQAKRSPVFIEKDGRVDTVIVSVEQFEAFKVAGEKKSMAQRRKEFNGKYKDWIAGQNAWVEKYGVPGEDMRPW